MKILAHCDGSITGGHWGKKGNTDLPHAWSGWWASDESGEILGWKSLDIGEGEEMSGNIAEYMAVRSALSWIANRFPMAEVEVYSDSQLIVHQLDGSYRCLDPLLVELRDAVLTVATAFPKVTYHWIRREQNKEADVLSKALQIWGRQPTWEEVKSKL